MPNDETPFETYRGHGGSAPTPMGLASWKWPFVAFGGLLATMVSIPAYLALIDVPFFRSSGLSAFACIGLGCAATVMAAVKDGRRWMRSMAGLGLLISAFSLVGFFGLAALPRPTGAALQLSQAPDFSLPDQDNRMVSLQSAIASGPVLLAFYRGHW